MAPRSIDAVDLFCGAGAASEAYERVCKELGLDAGLIAINHWDVAIATHKVNHASARVRHLCASVEHVIPQDEVPSGRLHLLLAGPECIFHSRARGGKPVNDQRRSTAWKVIDWLTALYIDNVLIENVPEFRDWGPLGANGKPLKSKKGQTYRAFINAIQSLGYKVEERVLCAADYGDPTTRERLFIMARRGNRAISWPAPTHSKHGGVSLLRTTKKWRAAREVIDWSIPSRSIFDPTRKPISPKTFARILAGLERFGGDEIQPFIVVLRNHADARSLDAPLPTVAAQGGHMALCEPFLMHVTHGTDAGRVRDIDRPLPTITGANRGELAVCQPMIVSQGGGGVLRPVTEPVATIATDGAHMLCEPFIVPPRGLSLGPKVDSVDAPLRTITAVAGHNFAVVEPFLVPHYGERPGQQPRTHSADAPIPTIPATGHGKFEVCEPFLLRYNGEKLGSRAHVHSVEDPIGTLPTENRFGVVEPYIIPNNTNNVPKSVDDPVPTVTGANRLMLAEPFIASYYGTKNISPVTAPLPTVTTKDRFALVMPVINGRALDIRLRMLQPKELAGAMSLDGYQFTGTKGDQVKQIGNAWPRRLGQALIQSLLVDYAVRRKTGELEAIA